MHIFCDSSVNNQTKKKLVLSNLNDLSNNSIPYNINFIQFDSISLIIVELLTKKIYIIKLKYYI